MKKDRFRGPLFIVGIGRSGTKLIRHLLNGNLQIGIPVVESNFIPHMIKRFGNLPDFSNDRKFEEFYKAYTETTFFWYMKEKVGYVLSKNILEEEVDKRSWSSIFEVILKYHVHPRKGKEFIWGDKSPSYLFHMKMLKDLYPGGKFLHIIRDPRDCCLSSRKIWGTNLYSYAEKWRSGLEVARRVGESLGNDYMEVHYEALLDDPEKIMRDICGFLGCEFDSSMIHVRSDIGNSCDAKGAFKILAGNKNKYINQLSETQIRRIEEIVYPVMESMHYKVHYADNYKPLSNLRSKIYNRFNKWSRLKYDIKTKGLNDGVRFHFGLLKRS